MNYFELFEIPVQLKTDRQAVGRKYFELSKKYHPDYFINEPEAAQQEALEKSAMLNKALKVLQNPDETIKYVLMQKGLLEEEEKYELPSEFLMDMMDINEALMEADGPAAVKNQIDSLHTTIYGPVQPIVENYTEGTTTNAELLRVKEYYYKKKYLSRLEEQLAGMM